VFLSFQLWNQTAMRTPSLQVASLQARALNPKP